jgi:hypothetical protein
MLRNGVDLGDGTQSVVGDELTMMTQGARQLVLSGAADYVPKRTAPMAEGPPLLQVGSVRGAPIYADTRHLGHAVEVVIGSVDYIATRLPGWPAGRRRPHGRRVHLLLRRGRDRRAAEMRSGRFGHRPALPATREACGDQTIFGNPG